MPSADPTLLDYDDVEGNVPQPIVGTTPPQAASKKSKKSKKKHGAQERAKLEEEEGTSYSKSPDPSPPVHDGVKLNTEPDELELGEGRHQPEALFEAVDLNSGPIDEEQPLPTPSQPLDPIQPTLTEPPHARSEPSQLGEASVTKEKVDAFGDVDAFGSPGVSPLQRPTGFYTAPAPKRVSVNERYRSEGTPTAQTYFQARRESIPRRPSSRSQFSDPPPPHKPQPHFFGLPDVGLTLGLRPEPGKIAGSDGCCCRFDSFEDAGDAASASKARDALLVGSQGALDVYRVLPDKFEVVGRLEGLRGTVVDAKIVPHIARTDAAHASRPLVVVILHGPMAVKSPDGLKSKEYQRDSDTHFQTTVEVYSLRNHKHVITLYQSTPVPIEQPVIGHLSLPPGPVGDLCLAASADTIVLASGKSGEVFVFSCVPRAGHVTSTFRCIGKFWTSLQQRHTMTEGRPSSSGGPQTTGGEPEKRPGTPQFSLSNRWLALVPPYATANTAIQGSPTVSDSNKQPVGLTTHAAPPQPAVTCEIAGVDTEDTLSWLSRTAKQGIVKVSQKGYEIGLQGWRELTNPAPPQQIHQRNASHDLFPPTNGPADDPDRLKNEPALISLIDLRELVIAEDQKAKQQHPPMATFALIEGCNHLSFSPDGLRLLTISRKGEMSTVWDLSHVAHGNINVIDTDESTSMERGPHVKIVCRINRSSPSVVLDSVWSLDGDWLALLTGHSTVHLHDIPSVTAPRKKKRRATMSTSMKDKAEETVSMPGGMSPPGVNTGWFSAVRSNFQSIGNQVSALKAQAPIPTSFAEARTATGRALGKGLVTGYSAAKGGASDMWHAEDNKIRLKSLPEGRGVASLHWIRRQGDTSILAVVSGAVHLYPVQKVSRMKSNDIVTGLKSDKYGHKTFTLPRINTGRDASTSKPSKCAEEGPHGFWSLRKLSSEDSKAVLGLRAKKPVASASTDVETNPPYCPFHIDSRVKIFAVNDSPEASNQEMLGNGWDGEWPWIFGGPLPPSTLMNPHTAAHRFQDGGITDGDLMAADKQVESTLTILKADSRDGGDEIRVSTRRAKKGVTDDSDEEGLRGIDLLGDQDYEDDDSMI